MAWWDPLLSIDSSMIVYNIELGILLRSVTLVGFLGGMQNLPRRGLKIFARYQVNTVTINGLALLIWWHQYQFTNFTSYALHIKYCLYVKICPWTEMIELMILRKSFLYLWKFVPAEIFQLSECQSAGLAREAITWLRVQTQLAQYVESRWMSWNQIMMLSPHWVNVGASWGVTRALRCLRHSVRHCPATAHSTRTARQKYYILDSATGRPHWSLLVIIMTSRKCNRSVALSRAGSGP